MDGELLRRELEVHENPRGIEIIFRDKVNSEAIQAVFQLISPKLMERGIKDGKTTLIIERNCETFLTPKAKEFLKELYREGCEIIFT